MIFQNVMGFPKKIDKAKKLEHLKNWIQIASNNILSEFVINFFNLKPSITIDRISNNKQNCSYLWSILSTEHLKNYDCWNCLWFPYYKSNASQRKRMLTLVKDKGVFLKRYSFVPICMWGHWSLVILCHEEEDDLSFIILLDSLHSIDPTKLVRPIQRTYMLQRTRQ